MYPLTSQWVVEEMGSWPSERSPDIGMLYLMSYYWTILAMTTIGNLPHPQNKVTYLPYPQNKVTYLPHPQNKVTYPIHRTR